MKRIVPILILIAALSTGCAMSMSKDGFHIAAGDSSVTTEETAVVGGSVSETFGSLISNLGKLVPFANQTPDVIVNVPSQGEE